MIHQRQNVTCLLLCLFLLGTASSVFAQAAQPDVKFFVEPVAGNISCIGDSAGNGNVGVSVGEDGVVLIDTKSADVVEKMLAEIAKISAKPIRFVVNTHWHFDHVGGNEFVGKTGAAIIAHENVYKRMTAEQNMEFFNMKVPPAPKAALPIVTFTKDLTFRFNGEEISVFHLQPGHTDGDAIVYFRNANVLQTGDVYFAGAYPYIGIEAGGSVNKMIEAIDQLLPMMNDSTKIIPGHGPLSNKAGLEKYRTMLASVRDAITQQIHAGKTLDEIIAAKPTQAFDAEYQCFFGENQCVKLFYLDLSRAQK